MPHLSGPKLTNSHTTATSETAKVVRLAEKLPEVTKISLGVIKTGMRSGRFRLKCIPISGGLRVEVRGATSVQQVYIYTSDPEMTRGTIEKLPQL